MINNLLVMQETWIQSLGQKDPLEKGMAPTPEFLPGEFQWIEGPGGLQRITWDRKETAKSRTRLSD